MSNSTTLLDQILSNQAAKEVLANALFDAMSPASIWGRHASACSGLTWGYYGGYYGSNAIANGTLTLTASTTNYVYADATTGAVSVNTTGFPAGSIPLYSIVTNTTTVTSYTDQRSYAPKSQAGASFANQNANYVFAGPTSGGAAAPTFRALVAADSPVFVASGASHAAGAVPDPGSTAGATRYLREDSTWQVPSGAGGSSTLSGLTDVSVTEGPAINGYSLTWNNSAGKWVATNVSAGSGLSDDAVHYSGANHPTITGFSTQQSTNMSGGINTLANMASGRGFTHTIQPPTTAAAEYHTYITQTVPAGSSWSIIAMMAWNAGTFQTYNKAGLLVMDASGNWVAFGHSLANTGQQGHGAYLAAAGLNTTPTNVPISGVPPAGPPCWFKLTYTAGGNFVFFTSVDGETWVQRYSVSVTAVIGTPTKTGLYNNCNDQSGVAVGNMSCVLSVYHYFQG